MQKNSFNRYVYKTFLPYAYSSHRIKAAHTKKLFCVNSIQRKTVFFHRTDFEANPKNIFIGAPSVHSMWKFPVIFRSIAYFFVCVLVHISVSTLTMESVNDITVRHKIRIHRFQFAITCWRQHYSFSPSIGNRKYKSNYFVKHSTMDTNQHFGKGKWYFNCVVWLPKMV